MSAAAIPESFWSGLSSEAEVVNLPAKPTGQWQPTKMMYWYDSIIDDLFSHPGTSVKETAARLGRNPITISLIARSDLFRARYAQRRKQFNADLDDRLTGKLAQVAEKSLDLTLEVLEKKQTSVPLPQLVEIQNRALDRLGYGAKTEGGSAVSVNINNSNAPVAASVSPEVLAEARRTLRLVEATKLGEEDRTSPPSLEARDLGEGSEGAS